MRSLPALLKRPGWVILLTSASALWILALCTQVSVHHWRRAQVPLAGSSLLADSGFAVKARVPKSRPLTEWEAGTTTVLEDGKALPRAVGTINEVRSKGMGLYKVKATFVYFSSSDNIPPLDNHRTYALQIAWQPSLTMWTLSGVIAAILMLACFILPRERQLLCAAWRWGGRLLFGASRRLLRFLVLPCGILVRRGRLLLVASRCFLRKIHTLFIESESSTSDPALQGPAPLLLRFLLGLVLGVFFHYLLYRIFLPAEPFIYVSF